MSTSKVKRDKSGKLTELTLNGKDLLLEEKLVTAVARTLASQFWHGAQSLEHYKVSREIFIAEALEKGRLIEGAKQLIALVRNPKENLL
jgi:hypothetical protein